MRCLECNAVDVSERSERTPKVADASGARPAANSSMGSVAKIER